MTTRVALLARPAARSVRALRPWPRLTVLGWHRIDDSGDALSTRVIDFVRQLDMLADERWTVLPLDAACAMQAAGTLPQRALALTFDDGYASVFETAWPLLRERGLPATAYVVSDYLDGSRRFPWDRDAAPGDSTRVATADQVRAAALEGLTIGSHTVSHPWLPGATQRDLLRELTQSRVDLQEMLGFPVHSVAYPAGGWNRRVRAAAATAGYRTGVTVDRGTNAVGHDRLALRRAFAPRALLEFELLLAGAYTWLRPLDHWRTRKGPRW